MLVSPLVQQQSILKILKHYFDLDIRLREFNLPVDDLYKFPDYDLILKTWDFDNVIQITKEPNEGNLSVENLFWYNDEISDEEFKLYMSYTIQLGPEFEACYEKAFGYNPTLIRSLTPDDIKLSTKSYDPLSSQLTIADGYSVYFSKKAEKTGKIGKETLPCYMLHEIFKSKSNLHRGINVQMLHSHYSNRPVTNTDISNYEDVQLRINKKFTSVVKLPNLIFYEKQHFKINPIYLLKD